MGLILRCTSASVLQTIQEALRFTSWALFNYGRSERLSCIGNKPPSIRNRAAEGKPLGLDVDGIRDWFTSSSDMTKLRYILRLFSFCDSELLRMAANLTSVLLVRQQRGLVHTDGKEQRAKLAFLCGTFGVLSLMLQLPPLAARRRQSSTVGPPRKKIEMKTLLKETSFQSPIFVC